MMMWLYQVIDILEKMTAEPDEGQEARLDADELDAVLHAVKVLKDAQTYAFKIRAPIEHYEKASKRITATWRNAQSPDYMGGGYTKCTNCGMKYAWGAFFEVSEFAYCPTCGAKMNRISLFD